MANTCANCKHWDSHDSGIGECKLALGNYDGPKNPLSNAYCPEGYLLTMHHFGCTQFTAHREQGTGNG